MKYFQAKNQSQAELSRIKGRNPFGTTHNNQWKNRNLDLQSIKTMVVPSLDSVSTARLLNKWMAETDYKMGMTKEEVMSFWQQVLEIRNIMSDIDDDEK